MKIDELCAAVQSSLPVLKGARTGKVINHSLVEKFQEDVKDELNRVSNDYEWDIEQPAKGRTEKDSIDILGRPKKAAKRGVGSIGLSTNAKAAPNWIIEIDATRTDQVSQKLLSRIALWGLKENIQYVAILYPNTQKGKNACDKYLRYGNEVLQRINRNSRVIGIFVDPSVNSVEIQMYGKRNWNHFDVNGKECKSMGEAAAEAIKLYLHTKAVSYAQLKEYWGSFVDNQIGRSRYKNTKKKTSDGITVHTYTQFRQYGLCSYWADFVRLAKGKRIVIKKMRRLYRGGKDPFEYIA